MIKRDGGGITSGSNVTHGHIVRLHQHGVDDVNDAVRAVYVGTHHVGFFVHPQDRVRVWIRNFGTIVVSPAWMIVK